MGKDNLLVLEIYELNGLCLKLEYDYERALKAFKKVGKAREEKQGFANR